ncbi:hypothetical protein B566_EDAN010406 [Ephemera danica]|nr:hypothetical protein B566_EDAN010406 [Ephemera danica]
MASLKLALLIAYNGRTLTRVFTMSLDLNFMKSLEYQKYFQIIELKSSFMDFDLLSSKTTTELNVILQNPNVRIIVLVLEVDTLKHKIKTRK